MTDDQLDDLKQLIVTTVNNAEVRIKTEIVTGVTTEIKAEIQELRQEMREGFASIGDIVSHHNDQLDDHETRLTKLESKAA